MTRQWHLRDVGRFMSLFVSGAWGNMDISRSNGPRPRAADDTVTSAEASSRVEPERISRCEIAPNSIHSTILVLYITDITVISVDRELVESNGSFGQSGAEIRPRRKQMACQSGRGFRDLSASCSNAYG
jgi:hypothetical protein